MIKRKIYIISRFSFFKFITVYKLYFRLKNIRTQILESERPRFKSQVGQLK